MTSGVYDRKIPPLKKMKKDELIYVAATFETKGKIYLYGGKYRRLKLNLIDKKQAEFLGSMLNTNVGILQMFDSSENVYYTIELSGEKMEKLLELLKPYFKGAGL